MITLSLIKYFLRNQILLNWIRLGQDSLLNFSYAKTQPKSLASRAQSDTWHVPINVDKKENVCATRTRFPSSIHYCSSMCTCCAFVAHDETQRIILFWRRVSPRQTSSIRMQTYFTRVQRLLSTVTRVLLRDVKDAHLTCDCARP